MAEYLSGGISFAGLGNGTDFPAMIEQLKKVESIPKKRYEAWRADWQKRYDAFDELLTSCTDLMKKMGNFSSMNSVMSKTVASSAGSVVNAKASADANEGTYTIDVKQLATNSVLTLDKKRFAEKTELVTDPSGPALQKFSYTYKGKDVTVNIPKGSTVQNLVDQINKDPNNAGVKASLIRSGDGYVFQLQGKETGKDADITINASTDLPDFKQRAIRSSNAITDVTGRQAFDDIPLSAPLSFTLTDSSTTPPTVTTHSYPPAGTPIAGKTLGEAVRALQFDPNNPGVSAKWVQATPPTGVPPVDGTYTLELKSNDPTKTISVLTAPTELGTLTDSGPDNWSKRVAQDAKYQLNGLNITYTSSTNQLTEVIDGLTLNLTDVGKSTLTVTNDSSGLTDKVLEFVDGFNTLMSKFQELTQVTENKDTKTTDSSTSLYASQQGSILTGNYGVQLLHTQLRSIATGRATGFVPADGKGGGDPYAALSSIGITIDAEKSSPTFGQLVVLRKDDKAPDSPYKSLDEAIEENPYAVAELLAGSSGTSDSTAFNFDNILTGVTKPGIYDVNYTVTGGIIGDVTIGGVKAKAAGNGQYTLTEGQGKGLTISILDFTEGEHKGTVRIKQGKAIELKNILDYQTKNESMNSIKKDPNAPAPQRGPLQVLKDNYKEIMNNIDKRIEQEEARLIRWEKQQKLQFSRLDTLLGQYDRQTTANAQALSQLKPFGE